MSSLGNFIKYNNTVPLVAAFLLLSFSGALAASPEARSAAAGAIYSQTTETISVDNTYIANKDLSSYTPQARITAVTEDNEHYYIAYTFSTIDLEDYTWRDVTREEVLTVSKADLGEYRDLGVYATEQLKQKIDRELARLQETQEWERKQISQRTVATTYGGLIGAFLDGKTETLPGYTPVVVAPSQPEQPSQPSVSQTNNEQPTSSNEPQSSTPVVSSSPTGSSGISLQVLGNNPANIAKGASYVDLGVYVVDPRGTNLGYKTYVNGAEVVTPNIDTSAPSTYTIEYRLIDTDGSVVSATRTVLVAGGEPEPAPETEESAASSTPQE